MKINWVPNKSINTDFINELLSLSLKSNQFTNNGPVSTLLTDYIKSHLHISDDKDVIPVSNGTVAIWVAVAAIDFYHNKKLKWATQSFTFPPSTQGYCEDVKIVDIDKSGGLDLYQGLENEVDGIIVTNVFGNVVDIDKYTNWCQQFNKYLVFDNAATSYTFYNNQNSLNFGNAATLSFHHTKPIGFGEGGAVIIDKCFAPIVKQLINFGIDNTAAKPVWHKWGGNYKISDISSAYIIGHLQNIQSFYQTTKELYEYFINLTTTNASFTLFPNHSSNTPFVSCLSLIFNNPSDSLLIQQKLKDNDIFSRKYYNPLSSTPVAQEIYNKILCIPLHYQMTKQDVEAIVELIN